MTSVDATEGFMISPDWLYSPSEADEAPTNELGKDEFLQLLVAQLKHQDPLNPTSSEEFIATTAQFTVVEKLDELTSETKNSNLISSLTQAGSLVGREITASTDGEVVTAEVRRTSLVGEDVVLETDKGRIRLTDVASIGPWASSSATAADGSAG
jgi:flagellar basal-body rod modification protein FlgD